MSTEVLLSNIIPFAGSGLVGYAIGFALKKILKWILIIIGFLAGMFFLGVSGAYNLFEWGVKYMSHKVLSSFSFRQDMNRLALSFSIFPPTCDLHVVFHQVQNEVPML